MIVTTQRLRGSVLLLALVFVLMLSLIAASVVQTATLQLHMAGNDQLREEAGQLARAIAAELSSYSENFLLASDTGHTNCAPADPGADCDSRSLRLPLSARAATSYDLDYRVVRAAPLRRERYPLPGVAEATTGAAFATVAVFEVEVRVDGRHRRRGSAHVVQGVALRLPEGAVTEGDTDSTTVEAGATPYRIYWREPGPDPL